MQIFQGRRAPLAWRQGASNEASTTAKPRRGGLQVSRTQKHAMATEWVPTDAGGGTFQAAWACNANTVI